MLTDAKVRGAKPRPKPYKLTDCFRLYLKAPNRSSLQGFAQRLRSTAAERDRQRAADIVAQRASGTWPGLMSKSWINPSPMVQHRE
ncbi:hypothetical protein ACFB49_21100 [Sphingomonas sp. DBB INV C78]|uniref:hypothetical protein n=1 Tax=Sphingomonas sp. DBB INV C78 TaxID=3349434 RepID=UPI0036D385B1